MGAKRARVGEDDFDEEQYGRPTQPVPVRIPREAFPSTRPPAPTRTKVLALGEAESLPRSVFEAKTIPPPGVHTDRPKTKPPAASDAPPATRRSAQTTELVAPVTDPQDLADIDDAWE